MYLQLDYLHKQRKLLYSQEDNSDTLIFTKLIFTKHLYSQKIDTQEN